MNIQWLGHSCFVLTNSLGKRLLTDPFDASVGYPVPGVKVDVATVSHGHHDHNALEVLPLPYVAYSVLEGGTAAGFAVKGFPTFHDDVQGAKRGKNIAFLIESDGERILHLGDLGHDLTDEQIASFGKIDVLLIPVGGYYTIDSKTAAGIAKRIGAKVTIPMHYKTPYINYPISDEKEFVSLMNAEYVPDGAIDTHGKNGTFVLSYCPF